MSKTVEYRRWVWTLEFESAGFTEPPRPATVIAGSPEDALAAWRESSHGPFKPVSVVRGPEINARQP